MSEDDRPVTVYKASDCDYSAYHPSETGQVVISFVCEGSTDIALELSPQALASLETRLEMIREAQRENRGLQ